MRQGRIGSSWNEMHRPKNSARSIHPLAVAVTLPPLTLLNPETLRQINMNSVLFEDQGIEDRIPFVGVTVATAKQRLRETLNIPYFADAIVNGEIVPVAHVLRDGDRLRFQKRFGVKAGDERPSEEREAEGLIDAYGLDEIAAEVKRLILSKDESIDLMVVMVRQWAARMFGLPDHHADNILAKVVKAIEARQEHMAQEPLLNDTDGAAEDWCNPASAVPPPAFAFGPLEGSQAKLSSWLFADHLEERRRLKRKAETKSIWVRQVHARLYEVWFRTQKDFDLADRRRREGGRSNREKHESA